MSPTRRDVLKSVAAATVVAALPANVSASPVIRTVKRGNVEYPIEPIDDALCDQRGSFDRLSSRIYAEQMEIQDRLVAHARETGVWLEEEAPGEFVARRHGVAGDCELVSRNGCTCQRYCVWHRCEHHALVKRTLEDREDEA